MNTKVMFSSETDNWSTPQDFFDKLNEEFSFNLDPCASDENHKCDRYFTKDTNGLNEEWGAACLSILHMVEKSECGLKNHMNLFILESVIALLC